MQETHLSGQSWRKRLRKLLLRSLLVLLVLILACGGYLLWFISEKPVVEIDYIAELNRISRPEGLTDKNNGWPDVAFALENISEVDDDLGYLMLGAHLYYWYSPRFCELMAEEKKQVQEWIDRHRGDWDLLTEEEQEIVTHLFNYKIVPGCVFQPSYDEIRYSKDRSHFEPVSIFGSGPPVSYLRDIDESDLLTLRIPARRLINFERLNNAIADLLDYIKNDEQIGKASLPPDEQIKMESLPPMDMSELVERFAPRDANATWGPPGLHRCKDAALQLEELANGKGLSDGFLAGVAVRAVQRWVEATAEPFSLESFDFTLAERKRLISWLEVNDSGWQRFVQGVNKEYWWWQWEKEPPTASGLQWVDRRNSKFAELRFFCYVSLWRAIIAFQQNDFSTGFSELVVPVHAGRHLMSSAGTLEQSVGMAFVDYAARQIISLLTFVNDGQNVPELYQFLKELEGVAALPHLDLRGMRLDFLSSIQQIFTASGLMQGHPTVYGLRNYDREKTPLKYILKNKHILKYMWLHAGRDDTQRRGCELLDKIELQFRSTPYELHAGGYGFFEDEVDSLANEKWGFVYNCLNHLNEQYEQYYRTRAVFDAARIILALKAWYMENDTYPETLMPLLAEKYLQELPIDPYSGEVFRYVREGDSFRIYSIGTDFDDDGGVQAEWDPWADNEAGGDRVFWPMQIK